MVLDLPLLDMRYDLGDSNSMVDLPTSERGPITPSAEQAAPQSPAQSERGGISWLRGFRFKRNRTQEATAPTESNSDHLPNQQQWDTIVSEGAKGIGREIKDVPIDPEIMRALKEEAFRMGEWHRIEVNEELLNQLTPFLEDAVKLWQQYPNLPPSIKMIGLETFIMAGNNTHQLIDQGRPTNSLEGKAPVEHFKQQVDMKAVMAAKQARDILNGYGYQQHTLPQADFDALERYGKEYATGMPNRQLEKLQAEILATGSDQPALKDMMRILREGLSRPEERDVAPHLTKEQWQEIDEIVDRYGYKTAGPTGYAIRGGAQEYAALLESGASERQLLEEWKRLTEKPEGPVDTAHIVILNGPGRASDKLGLDPAALRDIINPLRIHFGYTELKQPVLERVKENLAG